MLMSLALEGVGPAESMGPIDFSPRLNFFTGDNGLGKSFILDMAWWALTRTWARNIPASPRIESNTPKIKFSFSKNTPGIFSSESFFDRKKQDWTIKQGRPSIPGIVIYAGVDGSFSAWDPARNYWNAEFPNTSTRPPCFNFSPDEVWNGLNGEGGIRYCNGLIHDWVFWQRGLDPAFNDLIRVLYALSPSNGEKLIPGKPVRIGFDVKDYPSIRMAYGQDIPLIHASAGMRRIVALAYLLVWTWREHQLAANQTGVKPAKEIIFLVDEIECHLHPQWQRRVVPSLMDVMQALTREEVPCQLIAATHSPLVLASVEPRFDEDLDSIHTLNLINGRAVIEKEIWAKQGDANSWLISDAFKLNQARSVEAEEAIEAAEAFMRNEIFRLPENLNTKEKINQALLSLIPGGDRFWSRWIVYNEK